MEVYLYLLIIPMGVASLLMLFIHVIGIVLDKRIKKIKIKKK